MTDSRIPGISRRQLLLGAAALGLAGPAAAKTGKGTKAPPARPGLPDQAPTVEALLAQAPAGAASGFVLLDAATGAVLEARGETLSLPPASVQKTITTLYALERLGADRRLSTRVLATGPVAGGVVQGDLVLAGGGDPTLDTDTLGDLVAAVVRAGVRRITGQFLVDATAMPAFPRIAEDQPEQAGYNPGGAGLQLNFNRVNFEWTKGAGSLVMDARGERYLAPVHVATMAAVNREAPLFTRADRQGVEAWSVAAGALAKPGSRWLPVRNVAPYVADVFRGLAAAQGLELPAATLVAAPVPGATVLARRDSDPLAEVLRGMLKFSTNITAETMGLLSSGAGDLRASAAAMEAWAQARLGFAADFVDHSGLGAAARITPLGLARALRAGDATPTGAALRGLMKEAGLKDDQGRAVADVGVTVRAKSGTLNFVSGLAGFIEPLNGRGLVFAIHTADLARRTAAARAGDETPPGLRGWLGRARGLQAGLIRRWAMVYGGV